LPQRPADYGQAALLLTRARGPEIGVFGERCVVALRHERVQRRELAPERGGAAAHPKGRAPSFLARLLAPQVQRETPIRKRRATAVQSSPSRSQASSARSRRSVE
jgi:hypothetical protein